MHKDAFGQIIYVGKAISLRRRVRQYFQSPKNQTPKVRRMVEDIREFEYITCGTEMEALILECNLIKKYSPYYNILLRDDKTYPYIKLTLAEDYPRILKTRKIVSDGSRYFGPYTDAGAVNTIIDLLNDFYCLKRCTATEFGPGFAPCLNYHIHRCPGVCQGNVSKDVYRAAIEQVTEFLQGKNRDMEGQMREKMEKASEEMNFEEAAVWRDHLLAIEAVTQKQRVVLSHPENIDIILMTQGLSGIHAVLFTVREGKLSGRENFFLGDAVPGSREEICSAFIRQYYFDNVMIPKEIMVASLPDDSALLEDWLSQRRGSKVSLLVPERGEKRALMELVRKDVNEMLKDIDERTRRQLEKEQAVRSGLASFLGPAMAENVHRIESFDISHINGVDAVGGMVVFYDGRPLKQAYRRFKIKTVEGPDDTGSMMEVLFRRFRQALDGAAGFTELPDLILMDGGLGQVHACQAVLNALKLSIPVAGMVKDDKHRTRAVIYNDQEYDLKDRRELYAYMGTIQEEVHRFAIDYHHRLRGKEMTRSVLDSIPGIGEKRRIALLSHFGSIEAIRKADAQQLAEAPGMNLAVAENVRTYFAKQEDKTKPKGPLPDADPAGA